MAISRKMILNLVESLPEEKLGKVLSYINFIKSEEETILLLEAEDEEAITKIYEEDEWYTSEEIKKMLEEKSDV